MTRREYIKSATLSIGYVVSATAVSNLLLACQSQVSLSWKPVFLDNNQANLLAELAETILPKTQTPGAKDLGIPQFIDQLLTKILTEKEQKEFIQGLEDLDAQAKTEAGKAFVELDTKQRVDFLNKVDAASPKFPPSVWGIVLIEKPEPVNFFRKLKSLTLMTYYTSEKVGKEIMQYNPVPGKFDGCVPYTGQNLITEG